MKWFACIGVMLVLALIPASASAAPVWNATPYSDQEIEYDIKLAGTHWRMLDYLTAPGCVYTYMADMSTDYSAWGDGAYCSIWIRRSAWPTLSTVERCRLIVHEVGHLIGKEHVDDPTNVMYGGYLTNMVVPECEPGYVIPTKPKRVRKKKRCKRRTSNVRSAKRCTTARRPSTLQK